MLLFRYILTFLAVSFLASSFLASCQFQPIYMDKSQTIETFSKIFVPVKNGQNNYEFRNRINTHLGHRNTSAPYMLDYNISITSRALTISENNDITRFILEGAVIFKLTDMEKDEILYDDTEYANTAYSATSGTYQTAVAAKDAHMRLIHELADRIIMRLSIYTKDKAP